MKACARHYAPSAASCLETSSRTYKPFTAALAHSSRSSSHLSRGTVFARSQRTAPFGSFRPHVLSGNGVSASFSTAAEHRLAEASETEQLAPLVGNPDAASASEDDGIEFESEQNVEEAEDLIQVEADKTDASLLLKNCGLSNETLRALEKRSITALFPIQKHVFDPAMAGRDLIGRAKTGSGKTLAFAIPVVENLLKEDREAGRKMRGRPPRAIVITPTRELANQVSREFQSICPSLSVRSFYGGVSVGGNRRELELGVDVAVGTPGRLIDLAEQRALDLSRVRFAILDESDQMLDMGFEEDMEKILAYTPRDKQTMLFSATLPSWVRRVARKYLNNHLIVDLLGDEGTGKISDTIKALGILVESHSKKKMLGDLLATYAAGKQSIVFTQTKREADAVHSVADSVVNSAVLHGDIAQASREVTLERFRRGQFSCLVATDVAARGLDIPSVDLVLHYDCPQTHESFVHRSGRTGRAGKTGTTLVMATKQEIPAFHKIVRASQTDIEMIGPPDPRDVMQASTDHLMEKIRAVQPEIIQFFEPAAAKLMDNGNGSQILAAALASMSGFARVPQPRSLLTQQEGHVTLRVLARPGRIKTFGNVMAILAQILGQQVGGQQLGGHEMIRDAQSQMSGVLLDMSADLALQVLQNASTGDSKLSGVRIDRPKSLTLDQILAQCPPDRGSGGRRGRYGGPRSYDRGYSQGDRFGSRRSRHWSDDDYDSYSPRSRGSSRSRFQSDRYYSGSPRRGRRYS